MALVFVVGASSSSAARGGAQGIVSAPAFTSSELSALPANDWLSVHGNLAAQNYSSLNQISTSNVSGLTSAWSTHLDGSCATASSCGAEGNALVYQGVMYIETGANDVFAIDGATGQHLWKYSPTWDPGFKTSGGVSRGIAMGAGMLFVPQLDGRLVALNMTTGGVAWSTSLGDWRLAYHLSAAPVYYDNMVIVGMSGGDSGNSDYVSAIDATNGTLLWHWNVIPGPGEAGYNTWGSKTAYHYGGGAIWDSVSVDPSLDLVYVGTGNQVPWNTRPPGKELYADAIVALHGHTGGLAWSYQTVHHDVWDDDIPATSILFNAKFRPYKILKSGTWVDNPAGGFNGSHAVGVKVKYTGPAKMQPALVLPSKMGFNYILNRKTGVPLIPTPEMKVDQTGAAGLNLWPTQPIPIGDYFTSQCVLPSQWTAPGPDGNPVQHGCTYTPVGFTHFTAIPHDEGEWMPSAFDPKTNDIYICTIDNRAWAMEALPAAAQAAVLKPGAGYTGILLTQGLRQGYTGGITAMNVQTNKIVWRNALPDFCYSGVTETAGGVLFVGHNDGHLEAYDASSGKSLWSSGPQAAGANAPAVTYTAGGKQYVSVYTGGNNHENTPRGDLVQTFALP
jgi:glucose dehydrogenase